MGPKDQVRVVSLRPTAGPWSGEPASGDGDKWGADEADDWSTDETVEPDLRVAECPTCGRQAQRGWDSCPWCRSPLPAYLWLLSEPGDDPDEDDPSNPGPGPGRDKSRPCAAPTYDDIDDPELLEQAESEVRRLPLRLPFAGPSEDSGAETTDEPAPVSWECPVCGGQAQRGWRTCPWCRSPLPAYIWRPEGGKQDASS